MAITVIYRKHGGEVLKINAKGHLFPDIDTHYYGVAKILPVDVPGYIQACQRLAEAEQQHRAAAAQWSRIEQPLSTMTPREATYHDGCVAEVIAVRHQLAQHRTPSRLRALRTALEALREHEERVTRRIADAIRQAKETCPEWPAERAAYQAYQVAGLAVQQTVAVRQVHPTGEFGPLRQPGYAKRWTGTTLVAATAADIAQWPRLELRDLRHMDGTLAAQLLGDHPTFGLAFGAILEMVAGQWGELAACATRANLPALAQHIDAAAPSSEDLLNHAQAAIARRVRSAYAD